jgi:serine/threonine protein kinase/tetratricopeptide (TPR) repeat protein
VGFLSTKRFTVVRRIGEGGMGVVYEAFDEERGTRVALKTLRSFDGAALARFKREFRALQGLAHPNLVSLDELFFEDGQWFFTMELLDGVDFLAHVRDVPSAAQESTVRVSSRRMAAGALTVADETRPAAEFDEPRLRDGLRQLLEGLAALHAAGKIHRDVKPSNVLVTREGRVVLLDFGLIAEELLDHASTASFVVGTPHYMAPEQAAARDVGAAADLYSVGVMLYELLTGRMPIEGPPLKVLLDKQTREPPAPSSLVPGISDDLDKLCNRLLRFDPALRPSAEDVLRTLASVASNAPHLAPRSSTGGPTFVGRSRELEELHDAFTASATKRLVTVLVRGESGVGKSALVRRFLEPLRSEALVLEGRCYEREALPYKALDGIIDALTRRLSRMPRTDVAAVLPVRCGILAQVFPVMLRVPQVAKEHANVPSSGEPDELRQRAFLALRELFTRLSAGRPTVVAIDDLQWADDDGLRALTEILRPPDAPPLLFIGTLRANATTGPADAERLRAAIPGDVRTIELANLVPFEARLLADELLRRADASLFDSARIAQEASGHPLFVEELVRHVALGGSTEHEHDVKVKLDEAIWSRIAQLEPETRRIAEVIVTAGKPLPQGVVETVAALEPADFHRRVAVLRASNLVRTGGARRGDAIEPYHDRVREAVLAHLEPKPRRSMHEALALAFETSGQEDPETIAMHWREAGNARRAAKFTIEAGNLARRAFAFERAAQWYEQAAAILEQNPGIDSLFEGSEPRPSAGALHERLGEALSHAGRGASAAEHYEYAAQISPPAKALDLRRQAADQLLRSGHFDRGIEVSRTVLAAVGMQMPTTRFGTIVALVYYRVLLTLRGLRSRVQDKRHIRADALMRIDICWSVGFPLVHVDAFVAMVLLTRGLLLALAAGEPERITHYIGMEVGVSAALGTRRSRRTDKLIHYSKKLAEKSGSEYARIVAEGITGTSLVLMGRFREAAELLERSLARLQAGSAGLVFERVSQEQFLRQTLWCLGRFKAMHKLQQAALRDALARGDVFAAFNARSGDSNQAWLFEDHPETADQQAKFALANWPASRFHAMHFSSTQARIGVRLYADDPEGAYALACTLVADTRRSLYWRVQMMRIYAQRLLSASALAMVQRGLGDRSRLLREVARCARALEREHAPWATPLAKLARAGVSLHRGDKRRALRYLEEASREFEALDMSAFAAATQDRAARLRGDDVAAGQIARARAFFTRQGVVAPERFIAMLVPGLLG